MRSNLIDIVLNSIDKKILSMRSRINPLFFLILKYPFKEDVLY